MAQRLQQGGQARHPGVGTREVVHVLGPVCMCGGEGGGDILYWGLCVWRGDGLQGGLYFRSAFLGHFLDN